MKKVILIGGSPYSGKTTLAREIAGKDKYSCISTDDLCEAIRAITNDNKLNPMSGYTHDEYILKFPLDQLIHHTTYLHSKMIPSIEAVIKSHAKWSSPAIIEGWALYPEWTTKLSYDNIDMLWLIPNKDVLFERIKADKQFYQNSKDSESFIEKYISRCIWHNNLIKKSANLEKHKIIEIDATISLEELVLSATKLLN